MFTITSGSTAPGKSQQKHYLYVYVGNANAYGEAGRVGVCWDELQLQNATTDPKCRIKQAEKDFNTVRVIKFEPLLSEV